MSEQSLVHRDDLCRLCSALILSAIQDCVSDSCKLRINGLSFFEGSLYKRICEFLGFECLPSYFDAEERPLDEKWRRRVFVGCESCNNIYIIKTNNILSCPNCNKFLDGQFNTSDFMPLEN